MPRIANFKVATWNRHTRPPDAGRTGEISLPERGE
jgi:hypothetical protein